MAKAAEEVVEDLPRAIVRRMVKEQLSQCSKGDDIAVNKDALLAFSESARIFIHYLTATADDICKESKRQTINSDDVLKALEEIEFSELIEPLKIALADFRQKNMAKRTASKGAEAGKKRKVGDASVPKEGRAAREAVNEESVEEVREEAEEDGNSASHDD